MGIFGDHLSVHQPRVGLLAKTPRGHHESETAVTRSCCRCVWRNRFNFVVDKGMGWHGGSTTRTVVSTTNQAFFGGYDSSAKVRTTQCPPFLCFLPPSPSWGLFRFRRRQVPFCLPERLLVQLHNDGMAERARKQVERMRSLYPDLMRSLLSHPKTAVYAARKTQDQQGATEGAAAQEAAEKETDAAPMALLWAFAMVRSRAFAADDDRFAFVPFLVR